MKLRATSTHAASPKPVRADVVEGDAADRFRQADGAAGLVLDPAHAQFVGPHVGAGNVVGDVANGVGEGADDLLLLFARACAVRRR